jgi:hypothetical protein
MNDASPEDRRGLICRLWSPGAVLAIGLAVCAAMLLLPERWMASMRQNAAGLLRPGQVAALAARAGSGSRGVDLAELRAKLSKKTRQRLESKPAAEQGRQYGEILETLRSLPCSVGWLHTAWRSTCPGRDL